MHCGPVRGATTSRFAGTSYAPASDAMAPHASATRSPRSRALLTRGRHALARLVRPALHPRDRPGTASPNELATLRALTEVVAAGGPIADADWAPVAAALAFAAEERPGFHGLSVRACRTLDRLGPSPFARLSFEARTACVAAHRLDVRPVPFGELLIVGRRVEHAIRDLLVPELIRAFFDAPVGWRVVGYDEALGECRDAFAYTRAPR